jgi:hypothetical protein
MKTVTILATALFLFMQTSLLSGFEIPTFENQVLQFPLVDDPLKIPLHYMEGVVRREIGKDWPTYTDSRGWFHNSLPCHLGSGRLHNLSLLFLIPGQS